MFTNTFYFIMPETYLCLSSDVFIDLSHVVPLFHFLCMLDPQPFVSALPWHSRAVLSAPVLYKYKFTTLYCYTYYCYSKKIINKFINFLQRYQDKKNVTYFSLQTLASSHNWNRKKIKVCRITEKIAIFLILWPVQLIKC